MFNGRRRWTKAEDAALREYVNLYGERAWDQICKLIPGRTTKQCRDRWRIYLNPNVRSSDFSKAEDDMLKILVERMGKKWTQISHMFNGRAPEMLKNRYHTIIRHEQTEKKKAEKLEEARQAFAKEITDVIFQKFTEHQFD